MSVSSSNTTVATQPSSTDTSTATPPENAPRIPKTGTVIPNRVFVGGISVDTSEHDLAIVFSVFGNVKSVKIIIDRSGVSRGYGFITFETEEEATRLQLERECVFLKNRKLNIGPAIRKPPNSENGQYNQNYGSSMRNMHMNQYNNGYYPPSPNMAGMYPPDLLCNPYYPCFGMPANGMYQY